MTIITLMTDFGLKDGNVGVMKGVIWSIAPQVQIADLSHLVQPQDITEAAILLARSAPYFPAGTIHVVVVDPGVGTTRRPMAARLGEQYYVGPDNGTITHLLERVEAAKQPIELVHLDQPRYWLPEVSHVFHGRDIFSPCAAHLAVGLPFGELGSPLGDPVRLQLSHPQRTLRGWRGQVIHIDHFGNIATNLRQEHLGEASQLTVRLRGVDIPGLVRTFGERPAGELIALYGSTGSLIVALVNGSAAAKLVAQVGDPVEVIV